MVGRLAAGFAVLALASCGSSAARPASPAGASTTKAGAAAARCGPAGAKTLASSSKARVYETGAGVYGCSASTHRRTKLGEAGFSCIRRQQVGLVRVVGDVTAYATETCGIDTGSTQVTVRRLSDGRKLASAPATRTGFVEAHPSVTSLVLSHDHATAWIVVTGPLGRTAAIEVQLLDHGFKQLDSGLSVDPKSLRLHGTKLSWEHGGHTRTATLS